MAVRRCPQESFLVFMSQLDFHGCNSLIFRVTWSVMRGSRLIVGPQGVVRFEGKNVQEIWWWFSLFSLALCLSLKHILIFKEEREVLQHLVPQPTSKTEKGETFCGIDFRYCLNGNSYTPPPKKPLLLWALEMVSSLLHEICNMHIHKWACDGDGLYKEPSLHHGLRVLYSR